MGLDENSRNNHKILERVKTRALNELVTMKLLHLEAKKHNISIPREEVEGRLGNWKEGYPPGGFEKMLKKQNATEAFLKIRIEEQILIEKTHRKTF